MNKQPVEQLDYIAGWDQEFKGYCEALIIRVNNHESYFIHRCYEVHIPLFKLKDDYDYVNESLIKEHNFNSCSRRRSKPNKRLPQVVERHQFITFNSLEEMLKHFPGSDLDEDLWQDVVNGCDIHEGISLIDFEEAHHLRHSPLYKKLRSENIFQSYSDYMNHHTEKPNSGYRSNLK